MFAERCSADYVPVAKVIKLNRQNYRFNKISDLTASRQSFWYVGISILSRISLSGGCKQELGGVPFLPFPFLPFSHSIPVLPFHSPPLPFPHPLFPSHSSSLLPSLKVGPLNLARGLGSAVSSPGRV